MSRSPSRSPGRNPNRSPARGPRISRDMTRASRESTDILSRVRDSTDTLSLSLSHFNKDKPQIERVHSLYEITPLVACVLIKMVAGSAYTISTYNSQLQTILGMV